MACPSSSVPSYTESKYPSGFQPGGSDQSLDSPRSRAFPRNDKWNGYCAITTSPPFPSLPRAVDEQLSTLAKISDLLLLLLVWAPADLTKILWYISPVSLFPSPSFVTPVDFETFALIQFFFFSFFSFFPPESIGGKKRWETWNFHKKIFSIRCRKKKGIFFSRDTH